MIAPALLLAEVGGALARRMGNPTFGHRAVSSMLRLTMVRLVSVEQQLDLRAAQLAADLRLRGADAVYVAVAESFGIPLVTWDREQLTRTGGRITAHTP